MKDLSQWYFECNVPMSTFSKLLKIINKNKVANVPSDARTVLHTPRPGTIEIVEKSGGKYTYFGIKDYLREKNR